MTTDLTRQALQATLGLKNAEHFRKTYLLPALQRRSGLGGEVERRDRWQS